MNAENIRNKFNELRPFYIRLAKNIKEALETFMLEANISYLTVTYRIKDIDSFIEKIERKNYKNPFEDIEDICGLRIICFYQKDVEKICSIINKEFSIKESVDKEDLLNDDQFGYRSYHFIGKIKKNWLEAPNYRGLEELKAEIQVRTILMHAWAEIEHKLAYKQKIHIPSHLKRKLYRISAKLEEADEQFEDIKIESEKYREKMISEARQKGGEFDKEIKLNLDSLQAFLDFKFPGRKSDIESTRDLLNELLENNLGFKEIINGYEKISSFLDDLEKETFKSKTKVKKEDGWAQVGIVRNILDLTNEKYYQSRGNLPDYVKEQKERWCKKINNKA
ncbi:MAG: (p)ppGpp synthetase [Ignavibacteriae bacterium]|nr:(p)ppGpp synthetase [Bacteroidota bacterium]MCB0750192.1 (p)ppGpp synthetase [Ignavibacteriota bacterium]